LAAILCASHALAQDILKYQAAVDGSRRWAQAYRVFSSAVYAAQPGDQLEYDVYLVSPLPGTGGIDAVCDDGSRWREQTGWVDQSGVSGHPGADLSRLTTGAWHHRVLPVPQVALGKSTVQWMLAMDGVPPAPSMPGAWYDNIVITRGGSTALTLYGDGAPAANLLEFRSPGVSWDRLHWGPIRSPSLQTGAFFFYWYDAPNHNADPNQMPYHPYGLINDAWAGYNHGYYSILNSDWWEQELSDLRLAGVDTAALICWGNHPENQTTAFKTQNLPTTLVPALDRAGSGVKIILFDDTTSQCCEWNVDHGRPYYPDPRMPLSDHANRTYFYERKIRPFFQAIPQRHWATHNGQPLTAGGRPMIITYSAAWFLDVATEGGPLWQWIKDRFAADFRDSNNNPIVPWLVHENSWFVGTSGTPADGRYAWGAATGYGNSFNRGSFNTTNIGPGYDDRRIRTPGSNAPRFDGGRLIDSFAQQDGYDADLLMIETWNELWEGTPLQRCKDYPRSGGGTLPETHYIDLLRQMLAGSAGLRPYDATFVRTWRIPPQAKVSSLLSVPVRNDGAMPWLPGEVTLGGRLLSASTGAVIAGTERTALAGVWSPAPSGAEYTFVFSLPNTWPFNGTYQLQLDLYRQGAWFASLGDSPVTKSIILNPTDTTAPATPSNFTATAGPDRLTLSWRCPSSPDVFSSVIRVSTSAFPTSTTGTLIAHRPARPNQNDSFTVYPLTPGVNYFFSLFAQDSAGNFSNRATRSASCQADDTPPAPSSSVRVRPDGANVVIAWINPPDIDYRSSVVRYDPSQVPLTPAQGELVADIPGSPGGRSSCIHAPADPQAIHYYAVFACDVRNNCAPAATLSPPAGPTGFTATAGNTWNLLRWTNPSSETYQNTIVVFRTDRTPAGPADGTVLFNQAADWGSVTQITHDGLINGTTYYYAAFAGNGGAGYSAGTQAAARPFGPADFDRDGDVDISDWGVFQACLSGPFVWAGAACMPSDLDLDYDVDDDDCTLMLGCLSGPNVYADPHCDAH
jgi:hypothetical protein